MKKKVSCCLVLVLAAVFWLGCTLNVAAASKPKTVVYAQTGTWGSLNPYFQTNYNAQSVHDKLWESFFTITEEGELINRGVIDYEVNDVSDVFTLYLREDTKWHDGTPLTAHDWVYAVQTVTRPELYAILVASASNFAHLKGVDTNGCQENGPENVGIKALDDYTLQISLDKPLRFDTFIYNYNRFYHPLPKHILADVALDKWIENRFWLEPVGCGPFKFVSTVAGKSVTFETNEDFYFDINFDFLEVRQVAASSIASALISGDIDMCGVISADDVKALEEDGTCTVYEAKCSENVPLTLDNTLFSKPVRQAIDLALDRQKIIDVVFDGRGYPSKTSIDPKGPHWVDRDVSYETDIDAAKKLLEAAGWDFNTVVKISCVNDWRLQTAVIIKEQLAEVGIKSDIHTVDLTAQQAGMRDHTYHMSLSSWAMHYNNPTFNVLSQTPGASSNLSHIQTTAYADICNEIDTAIDDDRRLELCQEYVDLMLEDLGQVGLARRNVYAGWSPKVITGCTALSYDTPWEWEVR